MKLYEDEKKFHLMVDRNLRGQSLERLGQIDNAIMLYEQNISDRFSGNYPYERLRILYTKRKQYNEAMRVCKAFMNIAECLLRSGSPRSDLSKKAAKFAEWFAKLQVLSNNSRS